MSKEKEWKYSIYPVISFESINNNINETLNILIDSIDKFSFGDGENVDEEKKKKINF